MTNAAHRGFLVRAARQAVGTVRAMHAFGVSSVVERLRSAGGGYESVPTNVGEAIFVEAGVEHRFTAYEQLAVLVIFERARD